MPKIHNFPYTDSAEECRILKVFRENTVNIIHLNIDSTYMNLS